MDIRLLKYDGQMYQATNTVQVKAFDGSDIKESGSGSCSDDSKRTF